MLLGEENIRSLPSLLDHARRFGGTFRCVRNAPGIYQYDGAREDLFPPCHLLRWFHLEIWPLYDVDGSVSSQSL